jgi:adenylosuccinate lyase
VIGPDATTVLDFMLGRMTGLIERLDVRPDAMRRNLELTGGRLSSERILLKLVDKGLKREEAYRWVQRCALAEGDFRASVASDADITAHLDSAELEDCFDVSHALRHVDEIIDRTLSVEVE